MTSEEPDRPVRNHGWAPLVAILVLLVAATGIALALTRSDDGGNDTAECKNLALTAEVDLRPAVRTDQPAKLAAAADILSRRLSVYGCSKVRVTGDRLHVSTTAEGEQHLDEVLQPGVLEFREVREVRATKSGEGCLVPVTPQADAPATACSKDGAEQYELGPAKVVNTDVEGAGAQRDQQLGQWQVLIHFTAAGQRKWTALTRETVGKQLAIVLDGRVITAPTIQEQIDGDAQVTGSFTEDSAKSFARILQLGALPIPLTRA